MITVDRLTKSFGAVKAVDALTFDVQPGAVTGFLGPNGAGKTTTLRMLLGLAGPDSGRALIDGHRYSELTDPGRVVGAVLEATSFHPGRSARNHLRVYCAALGIPDRRADEVLELVGLAPVGGMAAGSFSLGMRQRLGLATALLGDPRVLILDEPANGLDPEGVAWLRGLFRHLAHGEGRTVLVSSHILSEVQQTVDRVVIISRGRLVRAGGIEELQSSRRTAVVARSPAVEKLVAALADKGIAARETDDGSVRVDGATAATVGGIAFAGGVELHELREERSSLEELFLELTESGVAPAGSA